MNKLFSGKVEFLDKDLIYPILFYFAGLIVGAAVFNITKSKALADAMKDVLEGGSYEFVNLFFNRLGLYFSAYSATLLFGMCLLGFPFIYVIPLLCGAVIAIKLSYFYTEYKVNGIGYSMLMIIPQASMFVTAIVITANRALCLSKSIFSNTLKKSDINKEVNLNLYLKSFIICALIITAIAFLNALITYLLGSVVTL